MPNWVYNGLTIEGNPEQVNKLVEQVGKSFTLAMENHNMGDVSASGFPTKIKQVTYTNPVFAFHNIINYKDMGITDEEYACQPTRSELDSSDPNWWSDVERLRLQDKSWYSWNITNWGTKWDVAVSNDNKYPNTYMEGPTPNGENLVVYYNFETAWGVAEEALLKLSSQYPNLLLTLSFEEETGWGGEWEFLRGEVISRSEYETKCNDCDAYDTLEYCEDCENEVCSACGFGNEENNNCETHREKADA